MSCSTPAGSGQISNVQGKFFGKYRGIVVNNIDPMLLGRIQAEVAAVPGSTLNWAMPCVPYAGFQVGFYAIPPMGANVWIEYEGGDPDYPIWVGCFWNEGEVPLEAPPWMAVFKTEFNTLILNDTPGAGGVTLAAYDPAVTAPCAMFFSDAGITLTCTDSLVNMTPVSIVANSGAISANAEAGIALRAAVDISLTAGAAVSVSAVANVGIKAGAAAEVTAGADVSITALGSANMKAVGVGIVGDALLSGPVEITSTLTSVGATNLLGNVAVAGGLEVLGDILMDGMQVMVVP